jgi:hypothetical protein
VKGLSLERKLPLLMTAVIAVVLAAAVVVLTQEIRQSSRLLATQQLKEKAAALGRLLDPVAATLGSRLRPILNDSGVVRTLVTARPPQRDLDATRALNPDLQTFEVWLARNKDRIPLPA